MDEFLDQQKNGEPTEGEADVLGLLPVFKLLGDGHRFRILCLLAQCPMTVEEIEEALEEFDGVEVTGPTQPGVSHHLALLRDAGIIAYEKDGKYHSYRLADTAPLKQIAEFLTVFVDDDLRKRMYQFLSAIERSRGSNGSSTGISCQEYIPPRRFVAKPRQDAHVPNTSPFSQEQRPNVALVSASYSGKKFPQPSEAFGAYYDRPLYTLVQRAERYAFKLHMEALAQRLQISLREILDHYRISRDFYYGRIDSVQAESLEKKKPEKRSVPRRKKVQDRTTEQKIYLYEHIECLCREGIQLIEACDRMGITLSEHTYLSINISDFRREMIEKRKQE